MKGLEGLAFLKEATEDREDHAFKNSSLCGRLSREGVTGDVNIYRFVGTDDPWQLKVVDHEGRSAIWCDPFSTAQEAYRVFHEVVKEDGMESFAASSGSTIH